MLFTPSFLLKLYSAEIACVFRFRDGFIRFQTAKACEYNGSVGSPVWIPKHDTCIALPSLCAMHGGPVGMYLPEHEHEEVQVEMHFAPQRGQTRFDLDEQPGFFSLIPSRMPHVGRWENGNEVIVVLLGPTQMEQASERSIRLSTDVSATACSLDPVIQAIGSTLRREFCTGAIADKQYLEAIGTVLCGHLVRHWTTDSVSAPARGRLSSAQLQRTIDFVESGTFEGFRIADLARQLNMGEHRFTRMFRRTTGFTPYQFLLAKRLDRARNLLKGTNLNLAELALELGFGSQSHFTSMFRQRFSVTPGAYRRENRSVTNAPPQN